MSSLSSRILVLQLARFGDIFQTWPVLKALQRTNPSDELHVLVRPRFKAALEGLPGIFIHVIPTADLIKPIVCGLGEKESLEHLDSFLQKLKELQFDRIINLSFSPASSYLTDLLADAPTEVSGYTRHSDGFLAIPDDPSAYFYAQVGVGRFNRYHLTELFAAVANVELIKEDFCYSLGEQRTHPRSGILVHMGASQTEKMYPPELWVDVLNGLLSALPDTKVTLIGSSDERNLADTVIPKIKKNQIENKVGDTNFAELFDLMYGSSLLIGSDSAPVHMAALTQLPVLNLSSSTVNFWETGPMSEGSRVLYADEIYQIQPKQIVDQAKSMLLKQEPVGPCLVRGAWEQGFVPYGISQSDFEWRLIQALYTGTPFPECNSSAQKISFQRLFELAELALAQLARWESPAKNEAAKILASVDEMLMTVAQLCPSIDPVVQWFQTQRLRLPPSQPEQTLASTIQLFEELLWVVAVYHPSKGASQAETRSRAIEMCGFCAPALREYDFASIEGKFQALVSTLQELSRYSEDLAGNSWSDVLAKMQQALVQQDFIELADQLEHELRPALLEGA